MGGPGVVVAEEMVCGVPARVLLVASKRRLLQDGRTKSSLSTRELVDEGDRTCGRALRLYPGVNTSCLARSWDTSISPSNPAIFRAQPVRR